MRDDTVLMTCCGIRYASVLRSVGHECSEAWIAEGVRVTVGGSWLGDEGTIVGLALDGYPKAVKVEDATGYSELVPLRMIAKI